MRKRIIALFLTGMLAVSGMLAGCSSKSAEKAQEYKELGIKQMSEESYEQAAESFQKALDQSVGRVGAQEIDVCYYKALAQYKAGDAEGAIETYSGLVDYDKKNWEVYYLRGSAYLQGGQGELALNDYNKAVSLNEEEVGLYAHIYENLTAAGYEEEAQKYLDNALKLKISTAEGYAGIGYVYFLKKDYANAEKNLLKAVDEKYDKALLELGQVYAAEGKTDEAKASFESYMEKYPEDASALNQLGEIALSVEDYEGAAVYFEKALDAAEKNDRQNIQRNLVMAYEHTGDFEKALKTAKEYAAEFPNDEMMQKEYEFLQTRVTADSEEAESVITGEIKNE